jgi:TolB-like protein/predicted Zn-dependent protease
VRVNAQLVDARTDRHLWGQTYDRDLADVFAIQSEIAKTIADQLQAKLSPSEKNAIQRPPTTDVSAFDLYARAKVLLHASSSGKADYLQAVDLLTQAVARDPSFLDAYCQLALTHGWLYFLGVDHTSARLALAEAALQAASRLRPDAGETHLARGQNLYWGYRDYDGALAELEVARQTLPNDAGIFRLTGYIQRRQGHWEESTRNLERAVELDPRDIETLVLGVAGNYSLLRRYAEAKGWYARALAFEPNDAFTKMRLAWVDLAWKADTRPSHQVIESIRATNPGAMPSIVGNWLICGLAEREAAAAKNALIASGENAIFFIENVPFNRSFIEGVIARMIKDNEKARSAFSAARAEQEKIVQAQPNYGPALCVLGLIDAGLGRKDDALREGQRAVELLPVEKDALDGSAMIKYLAMIAAWLGNKDLACDQLAVLIRRPSGLSYGELKLLPFWDPLRGDPRFEKIVEEAKQPVAIETTTSIAPEESIAVLPFENLSPDPDSTYFADGIQEEILTRLASIADLRVISRTSTSRYQSKPRNLGEIAKQLGVANILEGRVQKVADQVRVSVQLVNAQTDSHLWAETYDRKLTDIFGVESEIAKGIAESLQAKLTGREEQTLAAKPTNNPEAYDAYLRGLAFDARYYSSYSPDLIRKAAGFYERAVQLDPNFAIAWARVSRVNGRIYFRGSDTIPAARRDEAKRALENAQKLEPNSPETLLALGYYQYLVLRDYSLAETTFERVSKMLPGSSEVPYALAVATRREGHWDQSIAYWEQALALDPRNVELVMLAAETYSMLRQFPAALKLYDRVLDIVPNDADVDVAKAGVYQAQGNLQEAARFLFKINEKTPNDAVFFTKIIQLRLERNYGEAVRLLQARLAQFHFDSHYDKASDQVWLALMQRLAGDTAGAKVTAEKACNTLEQLYRDQPGNVYLVRLLALARAAMGEKDSALREAGRAVILQPPAKDAVTGPAMAENLALIQMIFGENSRAISILTQLLQTPYNEGLYGIPITSALLRLDPLWDPLRADPAFQKLCEEKQP